jgi:hypothetical protein
MKQDIPRLEAYMRKAFAAKGIAVRPSTSKGKADVLVGAKVLGQIVSDTEDGETTYHFGWTIKEAPQSFSVQELVRVQTYLREVLGSKTLSVRARGRLKDSAEVFVGDESLAIISADKDCYQFQMAILDIDLEDI